MTKNHVHQTSYLRNHTSYDFHLWYAFVKWYISRCFFHFFKTLIFWVVMRVKGQKMVQNNKKFGPLCSISQKPYIIWLSFMVHKLKMIISQLFFQFFKILIFQVVRGCKSAKKGPKWQKFGPSGYISQEPYIMGLSFIVHLCKVISPGGFSFFSKVWFFRLLGG